MKVSRKIDLIDFFRSNSERISSYGVRRIGVFGSFVRNCQTDSSDIDILVEFDREKETYKNFIQLAFFLEDSLERKVDLLTSDSLSPYIGPKILKEVEYVPL